MKKIHFSTFLVLVCVLSVTSLVISSASQTTDSKEPSILGYSERKSFQVSRISQKPPRWSYQTVGTVNVVAVSANGLYVLIGTSDGYLYLFNSSSNIPLYAENVGGSVSLIVVSYYGEYVATATGNTIKVYNISGDVLQHLWSFTNVPGSGPYISGGIHSFSFSVDGTVLAVGTWVKSTVYDSGDSYLYLFNSTSGAEIWSKTISHIGSGIYGLDDVTVDISSTGEYIVAGSTYNHQVYLFNQTGAPTIYL